MSAAARLTGVPANTLRTWERRYGFPLPRRTSSGRRLFGDEQLAAIRRMAVLIEAGVPPTQAAEAAAIEATPESPAPAAAALAPEAEQLLAVAERYDETGVRLSLDAAIRDRGWALALREVLFPALHEAGKRWEHGDLSLTHEHFLTQLVRAALLTAVRDLPLPTDGPSVLLACPEGEQHELGLLALWLLLREAEVRVVCLGTDVPPAELVAAAIDTNCAAVCLSIVAATSLPHAALAARMLVNAKRQLRVFVGGPALGRDSDGALPGTLLPSDIIEAVELLRATVADNRPQRRSVARTRTPGATRGKSEGAAPP